MGAFLAKADETVSAIWHQCFGHLNYNTLSQMVDKELVTGISVPSAAFKDKAKSLTCEACTQAKQHRVSFDPSDTQTTAPLELIHTDVCGPFLETLAGNKYFGTVLDDYTGYALTVLLKHKSDMTSNLQVLINTMQRHTGCKVKSVRTDNGGEYVNNAMKEVFEDSGIVHKPTLPYSPHSNGKAERLNRTFKEKALAMLRHSNLQDNMWGEAVITASHVRNRSPMSGKSVTP